MPTGACCGWFIELFSALNGPVEVVCKGRDLAYFEAHTILHNICRNEQNRGGGIFLTGTFLNFGLLAGFIFSNVACSRFFVVLL